MRRDRSWERGGAEIITWGLPLHNDHKSVFIPPQIPFFPPCRDHAGGNEKLVKMEPGLRVYGGDGRVGALTQKVSHLTALKVKGGTCRTLGSPSWCHSCWAALSTPGLCWMVLVQLCPFSSPGD